MAKYLDATGITTLWNKCKSSFLSKGGGSISGDLTVSGKAVINCVITAYSPDYPQLIRDWGLRSDYTSAGHPTGEFLKAWSKWAQSVAPGRAIQSCIGPNSTGYIFAHAYNSGYSSDTGLPMHLTGCYFAHSGYPVLFGTSYGNWYEKSIITSGTIGSQSVSYASSAGSVSWGNISEKPFNWSGQSGQPTWLWGSNDGTNYYVWNPANFSVNYAASAGSASYATYINRIWQRGNDCLADDIPVENKTTFYMYDSTTTNKPSGAAGFMIANGWDWGKGGSLIAQNFDDGDGGRLYTNFRQCDGNWSGWKKVAFVDDITWNNVSGKPSTFTPSSHTHSYLPLSGGSISGSGSPILSINTQGSSETGIRIDRSGTGKAWIGYHDSYGVYLYNSARGKYLNYKDDGSLQFEGNKVWHAGNDGSGSGLDADTLDNRHATYFWDYKTPSKSSGNWDVNEVLGDTVAAWAYGFADSTSVIHGPIGDKVSDARAYYTLGGVYCPLQLSWYYTNSASLYARTYYNGTWYSWKKIAFTENLPTKASWNYDDVYSKLNHTHSYLPLSGGTVTGALRITHRLTIGYDVGDWNGSRAELELITAGDDANDFWMGANSARKWGLSARGSSDGYALQLYNSDLTSTVRVQQNGNVGIGNNSPGYKLHVNGSANATTLYENGNRVITTANIGSQSVNYANSAGSAGKATFLTPQSYTPTNNTVAGHKAGLVNWLNNDSSTGIGKHVIVSASIINQWDNDSATYYDSSVYAMVKIGGGYNYSTYGQWLLSSYNQSRLGVVGRNGSVWSSIKWLAWSSDIPTNTNQLTNGAGYITSSGSCNYANSAGNATTTTRFAYITDWNSPKNGANIINLMSDTSESATTNGAPVRYASGISIVTNYVGFQLASYGGSGEALYFRKLQENGTWHSWYEVITSANISSYAATSSLTNSEIDTIMS